MPKTPDSAAPGPGRPRKPTTDDSVSLSIRFPAALVVALDEERQEVGKARFGDIPDRSTLARDLIMEAMHARRQRR